MYANILPKAAFALFGNISSRFPKGSLEPTDFHFVSEWDCLFKFGKKSQSLPIKPGLFRFCECWLVRNFSEIKSYFGIVLLSLNLKKKRKAPFNTSQTFSMTSFNWIFIRNIYIAIEFFYISHISLFLVHFQPAMWFQIPKQDSSPS